MNKYITKEQAQRMIETGVTVGTIQNPATLNSGDYFISSRGIDYYIK